MMDNHEIDPIFDMMENYTLIARYTCTLHMYIFEGSIGKGSIRDDNSQCRVSLVKPML